MPGGPNRFPLWLKVFSTLFIAILIPAYARQYGWRNFLWFSDVALFASVAALWSESAILASMMALAVTIPEAAWNFDYFARLFSGHAPIGMTAYMFDPTFPLFIRGLSLFHIWLPVLLIWMVWHLGYDRRALLAQTALAWVLLPATWLLTEPRRNINWVFGLTGPQTRLPGGVYLALLMAAFPLLIYLPTHLILSRLMGRPRGMR